MNYIIESGKAFYWGTSEWNASQIMEAYNCCEKLGLIKPIVEQPQYNMFVRTKFEKDYEILFKNYKMGSTIWSPLMGGVLTGKYLNEVPKGSRFDLTKNQSLMTYKEYNSKKKQYDEKIKKLMKVAERLGCPVPCLAIAWTIKNPDVSTCILGVSRVSQLKENIKALDVLPLINDAVEKEIEQILSNTPLTDLDWRDFKPAKGRRAVMIPKF